MIGAPLLAVGALHVTRADVVPAVRTWGRPGAVGGPIGVKGALVTGAERPTEVTASTVTVIASPGVRPVNTQPGGRSATAAVVRDGGDDVAGDGRAPLSAGGLHVAVAVVGPVTATVSPVTEPGSVRA